MQHSHFPLVNAPLGPSAFLSWSFQRSPSSGWITRQILINFFPRITGMVCIFLVLVILKKLFPLCKLFPQFPCIRKSCRSPCRKSLQIPSLGITPIFPMRLGQYETEYCWALIYSYFWSLCILVITVDSYSYP